MKHFKTLLIGELKRLIKYKIALVGLVVSFMWVAIIAVLDTQTAPSMGSMLVFTDAGMLSVVLLISSLFFEKQEGTLRTTMITPVNKDEVLVAKVVASLLLGLVSATIVALSVVFLHGNSVNFLLLTFAVLVTVIFNSMVAFVIALFSKNFNNMLINYMIFVMVLVLPAILLSFGVFGDIGQVANWLIMISPMQACQVLIDSAFVSVKTGYIVFGFLYSTISSAALYIFVVRKYFKKYAQGD